MSIFVGDTEVAAVKVGSVDVVAVYVGSTQIWPVDTGITKVASGESALAFTNRTTHNFTYNLTSTTQDGTIALLIFFCGDDGDEAVTASPGTLIAQSTTNDSGKVWCGYYIPDSTDMTAGDVDFAFTTSSSEVYQYIIYELSGVNTASPVADSGVDASNADRATTNAISLTAPAGSFLACGGHLNALATGVTLNVSNANGFAQDHAIPDNATVQVAYGASIVMSRIVDTADNYDSPIFGNASSEEMAAVAVAVNPA